MSSVKKIVLWFMIIIIAGLSTSAMYMSQTWNLNRFFDAGNVYELAKTEIGFGDYRYCYIKLKEKDYKWNYLYVNIEEIDGEWMDWYVEYRNAKGEVVSTGSFTLKEGKNVLTLNSEAFSAVNIRLMDANQSKPYITVMEFRDEVPFFEAGQFIRLTACFSLFFLVIAICFASLIKKARIRINWYFPVELLQKIFMEVGNALLPVTKKIPERIASRTRTFLFLILIFYMQVIDIKWMYNRSQYFRYHMLLYCICFLFIAILSIRRQLIRKNWKNPLVGAWFSLWMISCISDFFVPKVHSFVGYVMIFVFGFLFFVWNNMDEKEVLIDDLMRSVKLSYIINLLFCLFCRPEQIGIRYMGTAYNPNIFSMYLAIVIMVMLVEVDELINKKVSVVKLIMCSSGILSAFLLIWKTQCRTGLLAAMAAVFVFTLKNFMMHKKRELLKFLTVALILAVPVSSGLQWGLTNIPEKWGTPVQFEHDAYAENSNESLTVLSASAAEREENQTLTHTNMADRLLMFESVEKFLSGRNIYYKHYISNMNLFGHEYLLRIRGKNDYPHNGLLAVPFRYGVAAWIPYVFLLFYTLYYAFLYLKKYAKSQKKYTLFPLITCFCTYPMIMAENLEQPFRWPAWIILYLMMGMLFLDK